MTCSRCHLNGHNAQTCSRVQPSQLVSGQVEDVTNNDQENIVLGLGTDDENDVEFLAVPSNSNDIDNDELVSAEPVVVADPRVDGWQTATAEIGPVEYCLLFHRRHSGPNMAMFKVISQLDDALKAILPVYQILFSHNIVRQIVDHTNKYGSEKFPSWQALSEGEFNRFQAVIIYMGIFRLRNR